ncbi:Insecticidal toxin complex protein [Ichthyenterobacterium magnum]|uniref:Insecticidal toxin complex protein n=1 Tax=Ichthyenterobacterium magnum TaxID=1230530 RepID=A0A420DGH2_9FLAO|nr:Insecticidal toxin complex protein [Ichthyenterobacterium magnum]RKE92184.1 hypothetical protein BXY80_2100 [Ichthyenterobacterium magnum]
MKNYLLLFAILFSISIHAKEWKSLRAYQKETQTKLLSPSDWLSSDRRNNTRTWQKANAYNLGNNNVQAYKTIRQRRDFYRWLNAELRIKGHEVVWLSMAQYISHKLRLVDAFPYSLFTTKQFKNYTRNGSKVVFNNVFDVLKQLYDSEIILKGNEALAWDKSILKKEQYKWIQSIYNTMDSRSLNQIERVAKGKFLYGLLVPKAIRFKGDISKAEERYNYALNTLRDYCKSL